MTHLTKINQRGLFSTTVAPRPGRETGDDKMFVSAAGIEQPFAIATDLTPDEARVTRTMGWSEPAARASVVNLPPPNFGKRY